MKDREKKKNFNKKAGLKKRHSLRLPMGWPREKDAQKGGSARGKNVHVKS